jgi:N-acetylmuramic acid 6-phosphate etherase
VAAGIGILPATAQRYPAVRFHQVKLKIILEIIMSENQITTATLDALSTEQRNPASAAIDALSTMEMVSIMNDEDAKVAPAVATELPAIARAIDAVTERIQHGGRLIYIGAGTSGRLGVLDASECPPTFSTDPSLVGGLIAGGEHAWRHSIEAGGDRADEGASALKAIDLTASDAVVGIAASGRTPYVLGAMAYARETGAITIGLSNSANSSLAATVDIAITPLPGPEIITGSTRMKAGTAQKLVLNMLSTGVMIKLGKTFGNLMVDVQPSNAKLQIRSLRIVQEATGLPESEAEALLAASNGEIKTAIVAALGNVDGRTARETVARHHGIVRLALNELSA